MGILYKLTSPSGKSYIGITSKTLDARWNKHVEHALGKRDAGALYNALRKYGTDSFQREELAQCDDWEELCEMEKRAIKEHNTLSPNGYNLTLGGEGTLGPRSEEARQRVSVAQKKRFQNPSQRALLREYGDRARVAAAKNRAAKPPKSPKPLLSKVEHSARTRAGMASPEVRRKVLARAAARAADPEWRKKISATKTGKKIAPCSEEARKKHSEAAKLMWARRKAKQS